MPVRIPPLRLGEAPSGGGMAVETELSAPSLEECTRDAGRVCYWLHAPAGDMDEARSVMPGVYIQGRKGNSPLSRRSRRGPIDTVYSMKPDAYTKGILTIIALLLAVVVFKPLFSPEVTARAQQGSFAGVQFFLDEHSFYFWDPRTGDIWGYNRDGTANGDPGYRNPNIHFRVPKQIGQEPLKDMNH